MFHRTEVAVGGTFPDIETMEWVLACESGRQSRTHVKLRVETGYFAVGCNNSQDEKAPCAFRFSASQVIAISSTDSDSGSDTCDSFNDLADATWRVNTANLTHTCPLPEKVKGKKSTPFTKDMFLADCIPVVRPYPELTVIVFTQHPMAAG